MPVGVLDALGIKSGSYPRTLSDILIPTLDILPPIVNQACNDFIETSLAIGATGLFTFANAFNVPQSEAWLVRGFSVSTTTLVTEQMTMKAVLNKTSLAQVNTLREGPLAGQIAAKVTYVESSLLGPFWVTSNDYFGCIVESITTAATISVGARISMLRCRR